MNTDLSGLTAIVTGASGGIGRAVAALLADEGCQLILHAHRGGGALRTWLADQPWRDRACVVEADIADPDAVARAFAEGEARFGRIDLCVANAGVWPPEVLPLHRLPIDRIREVIAVDLLGATWTARAWMDGLDRHPPRADGRGASLVFIGSTAGRFGEAGHADYAMAKAGLLGLVLSLKNEVVRLDRYARVNLVAPGWTVTEMAREALEAPGAVGAVLRTMPLRQLARPVDVARQVAVLLSPALSRHVSGEVVTVAGGMEGRVQGDGDADLALVLARLDQA